MFNRVNFRIWGDDRAENSLLYLSWQGQMTDWEEYRVCLWARTRVDMESTLTSDTTIKMMIRSEGDHEAGKISDEIRM